MAVIAVIGAGAMGSGIAARLVEGGATVIADLEGRSTESRERARAAGMAEATPEAIVRADLILSIVPPAEAVTVARQVAAIARREAVKPVFIDCNAIAPGTMAEVAAAFGEGEAEVLDGSIIGAPPKPGGKGPRIYVSSDDGDRSKLLADSGLDLCRMDAPLGAASALKMCYAGINKGLVGLGTAMMLAAIRSGADDSLKRELEDSAPEIYGKLARGIPDMYSKAYRWVAEMEEIAEFLGEDDPAAMIYRGMAGLYRQMAEDRAGGGALAAELNRLLAGR